MVIHCVHCKKLFYIDDEPAEQQCPVCNSAAQSIASTIVFGSAANESSMIPTPTLVLREARPESAER